MKSILLIGVGDFGTLLAKQCVELGHEVMVVDINEDRVNEVMSMVTDALIGDSTNEGFIASLGVNNFDACIVTIGKDFLSALETTSLLKESGAKHVVARANKKNQEKFLLRNGADEVVNPEKQVAKWTAIRCTSDLVFDFIQLDENTSIYEVSVPKEWVGKSVIESDIRKKYGITIVAIKENGKIDSVVVPDMVLDENMTLLVLGENKAIEKCFHIN